MKGTYNREAAGIERPHATFDMNVVEVSNQVFYGVSHPNFGVPHERVRITMSPDVARAVRAYASEGLLPICRTNHMGAVRVLWKDSVPDKFVNQSVAVLDGELCCFRAQTRKVSDRAVNLGMLVNMALQRSNGQWYP